MDQATILRGKPGRIMLAGAAFLLLVAMPYLLDRKSTRLNSSHLVISYAVFCLKKKNKIDYYGILKEAIEIPTFSRNVTYYTLTVLIHANSYEHRFQPFNSSGRDNSMRIYETMT